MKLRSKVLIIVAVACMICTASAVFVSMSRIQSQGELQLRQKSAAILSRLESVRSYIASQGGLSTALKMRSLIHRRLSPSSFGRKPRVFELSWGSCTVALEEW